MRPAGCHFPLLLAGRRRVEFHESAFLKPSGIVKDALARVKPSKVLLNNQPLIVIKLGQFGKYRVKLDFALSQFSKSASVSMARSTVHRRPVLQMHSRQSFG